MAVDDRAFAAAADRIAAASRQRAVALQAELAEQWDAARTRAREHLQPVVDLSQRAARDEPAAGADDESFEDRRWLR